MRYHGVDLHKRYATISVRDDSGEQVRYVAQVQNFAEYVACLGSEDAVVLESSSGSFWWAERIQRHGVRCVVIDPYRFRIIRDSWHKTDRRDAAALSLALWMSTKSGELVLPEVWQPTLEVRELRRLFGQWQLLTTQIRQLKAQVQGVLLENGISDAVMGRRIVNNPTAGLATVNSLALSSASAFSITMSLEMLTTLLAQKKKLLPEIYRAGLPLEREVRLLITIRGVTALLALGFLAEVGDVKRFHSLRGMLAYLGVVPTVRSSGGTTHVGHINRCSRSLCRTLFTQSVIHLAESSPTMKTFYLGLRDRKGYGRARIAVLRKTFGMMRRMLLDGMEYKWKEQTLSEGKLRDYLRIRDSQETTMAA